MPLVASRAGRIHVAERGDGPPIVLLHATGHDHHDFDPIVDHLADRFRVLAVDWPGHGESDPLPPEIVASAMLFADVLDDLVDALGLDTITLIGNSVGGYAAARLAATRPELVSRLVLVNTGGYTGRGALVRAGTRILGTPALARTIFPRLIPRYMRAQSENDHVVQTKAVARARTSDGAGLIAALWRSFADPDYDLRGARIVAPTLLVWGMLDIVLPPREARSVQTALPAAQLVTLETGHVVFSSDPDGFLSHVTDFLNRADSSVKG
ncbi:alpha/beta fold hydrolase [Nocardia mexicana]|uniref:Pimeloyl-ACP methyl ester carboxylesterase n=1 Tax=Nocardia mexicana TaxID=279262 RepID=A0A370GX64_9NOCA|nr:alpha/beta hydrolase [Nocardia mexicana]RDI47184.1 pimeloyl-ACP methyl ester carboxylesterase [Nocardia mexicana]